MSAFLYINVPFHEKDEAKELGARWDAIEKAWFIPKNTTINPFKKWLPEDVSIAGHIVLKQPIYFVDSIQTCWRCSKLSKVSTFAASGFECEGTLYDGFIIFSEIMLLSESLNKIKNTYRPLLKLDYSKTIDAKYYMNHCEHCGAKIGDFYLHDEFDAPFNPIDESSCKKITVYKIPVIREISYLDGEVTISTPSIISLYSKFFNCPNVP